MGIETTEHLTIRTLLNAIKKDMEDNSVVQIAVVIQEKEDGSKVYSYSRPIPSKEIEE